jgi:hypothetical protein
MACRAQSGGVYRGLSYEKEWDVKCPECNSENVQWATCEISNSGVQDGRLKLIEVECVAILSCYSCSNTVRTIPVDSLIAELEEKLEKQSEYIKTLATRIAGLRKEVNDKQGYIDCILSGGDGK